MDTLTHALSGALLARASEPSAPRPDQLPRRLRMAVGFLAAAFPDTDFVLRLFDPLTYLSAHRGVTHSLLLLPLWAIGLALLFAVIVRKRYSWKAFVGTCALGIAAHIAGDVITAFGTIVFAPFSAWRAQIPATFIIDPYFTGIIVAGLVAGVVWRQSRLPAVIGLAVLAGFVGFQYWQHQRAVAVGDAYIAANKLESAKAYAIPQPFSPFNWMIVVQQPREYRLAYVSLTRDTSPPRPDHDAWWFAHIDAAYRPVHEARWQRVSRFGIDNAAFAESAWKADGLARYRDFAMFPALYRVDRTPGRVCVWFDDLRFKLEGRHGPFRYGGCRAGAEDAWKIYRLGYDGNGTDLLERIPD
ncbi:MAG TPA: metal-dependent hydrolase [Burkholderiales bacterium]|nr:metal-dependent hydrolase [Burkholderiales bacterium]